MVTGSLQIHHQLFKDRVAHTGQWERAEALLMRGGHVFSISGSAAVWGLRAAAWAQMITPPLQIWGLTLFL